jgi:tRNA-specific 2-thiouridylase
VVAIDADKREVIVGPREALARARVHLDEVNWLGDAASGPIEVLARIRSTGDPAPAHLHLGENGQADVVLSRPEEGVSPGQACVFYAKDGDRVLGGGWIKSASIS